MRCLLWTAILVIAHQGFASVLSNRITRSSGSNALEKVFEEGLRDLRRKAAECEPFRIAQRLPRKIIRHDNAQLDIWMLNLKLWNVSNFVVDNIEVSLVKLLGRLELRFPQLRMEGFFMVNGTLEDQLIQGEGDFSVEFSNFSMSIFAKAIIVNKAIHMTRMDFDYTVRSVQLTETILKYEGTEVLDGILLNLVEEKRIEYCEAINRHVTDTLNRVMEGKNVFELINWVNELVYFSPNEFICYTLF